MQRRSKLVASCALASLILVPTPERVGAGAVRAGSVTGWVPYWKTSQGVTAINAAGPSMTEVLPFWFSATSDATAIRRVGTANDLTTVVAAARSKGMLVIPTVTDGSGVLRMQTILADATTRAQHEDALVALVVNGGFDGVDLDYEGFAFADPKDQTTRATTRTAWLVFLQELAQKLHASGRLLSVTVPPRWFGDGGRYDMYGTPAQMTAVADRLRLMVYDWSVAAPGPIAPMSWVNNVISFLKGNVPPGEMAKVWLGVPQHGRNWGQVLTGECPDQLLDANGTAVPFSTTGVTAQDAPGLASAKGATIKETTSASGALEREKTFSYTLGTFTGTKTTGTPPPPAYEPPDAIAPAVGAAENTRLAPAVRVPLTTSRTVTCTAGRVVHFPDNDSVLARAQAAANAGLGGIAIWAMSYEPLDLWSALATS